MKNKPDPSLPKLLIAPSVPVWTDGDGYIFDRKFYDGMCLYAELWQGRVACVMNTSPAAPPPFGLVRKKDDEMPFAFQAIGPDERLNENHLNGVSIVLASGDNAKSFHISGLCHSKNIKCVYIIEYIPETRRQIARLGTRNHLRKIVRVIRVQTMEQKRLGSFANATGIQANGVPAYERYKHFGKTMLYLDTRAYKSQMATEQDICKKLKYNQSRPLRLAFSGRLIRMKGADHLLKVAKALKSHGTPFRLSIFGAGELDEIMRSDILNQNLSDSVTMHGAVDFYKELMPYLINEVDLFVCLHRQSDPSCTYLETLSCGVPIVGYDNKAFSGILRRADVGWAAPMNNYKAVARVIETLNENRQNLYDKSIESARFAHDHDFETTFHNRIRHLQECLSSPL